jgi:ferredoxin
MKSITKQKPFEEILKLLEGCDKIFITGCGTCTTMTKTGGIEQVEEMKQRLQDAGKLVTGDIVIPISCDEMTGTSIKDNERSIQNADCVLVMSCALGLFKISSYVHKSCIPAQDTLFIGVEDTPGNFQEVCAQCGQCVLGFTAGICPITFCHKSLLNGPCGGTNKGKCEVDKERDCAWTLIYNRLNELGRLDLMRKRLPPKNYQASLKPRKVKIT